ncbi:hybrid sensor histidine kinase/response regulator [Polymorphobacter glacialis]|uniref:histidine kinase n=1 Tax=Sandarakinorhabdus glacialis TaxID=1614636 RepID=A0A917E5Z2_9SPHN|nr:hybrid sensor histidine kinase/response regulator [Polymorphobacter glacialis]
MLSQPIRHEKGHVSGIFVGGHDVSEHVRSEKARIFTEARVDALNSDIERQVVERADDRNLVWKISPDLMGVLRADGHFETTNPAWHAVLGWTETEVVSMSIFEMLHPEDAPRTRGGFEAILTGATVTQFENRYRCKDGGYRLLSWIGVPEAGKIYCIGRDITAEREAASRLALAEEALRQSQKLEALGQLTGGVAHDFNDLLMPIMGRLDMLLRRGIGDARERRLMEGALQSAERARTLVQRLLAFARRQPLQTINVDVPALITGMADLIASTTGPQIRVVVDIAADVPAALAHANQLEMALLNLSLNARDAMADGGTLRITVGADTVAEGHRTQLPSGNYVRIGVADTGSGMDAETLARAVEPFYSTKGIGKGTGLGLSMVHGLLSQLGGAMTLSSEAGQGTNIELWLPTGAADHAPVAPGNRHTAIAQRFGRILLVDDEPLVRASAAEMLLDMGYEVVEAEAESAEAGLQLVEDGLSFVVLVTDHLMAGMTDVELARRLQESLPDIRVLIVSGYAEAEGIAADLPRLTKPFRQAELAAMLLG